MTKQEYKMMMKLIDRNMIEIGGRETMYGVTPTEQIMDESGIEQLKQDIKDLFEEHCDETNGAEYAERIMKAIEILQRIDCFRPASSSKLIPIVIQVLLGKETKKYDKRIETL